MGDSKRCLCQALMGEGVVCQPALFRLLRHPGIHRLREDMSAAGEAVGAMWREQGSVSSNMDAATTAAHEARSK